MNRVVIVFLKYPEPGQVKTRLARGLGDSEAARVYRWLAGETMRAVMESGDESGVSVRVLFDPPEREADVVSWVSGMVGGEGAGRVQYRAQDAAGDLGGSSECVRGGVCGWLPGGNRRGHGLRGRDDGRDGGRLGETG